MDQAAGSSDLQSSALDVAELTHDGYPRIDQLCSFCATLNFQTDFAQYNKHLANHFRHFGTDGSVIPKLLFTSSFPFRKDCALCRLLYETGVRETGKTDGEFKVCLCRLFREGIGTVIAVKEPEAFMCPTDFISSAVFVEEDVPRGVDHEKPLLLRRAEHCSSEMTENRHGLQKLKFIGRAVVSPYLTTNCYSRVKTWLTSCKSHHKSTCESLDLRGRSDRMSLIDCDELVLFNPRVSCPPYIALSYIWGCPKSGPQDLSTSKSPSLSKRSAIPKTIQDAVKATKALGFRFLWVDQYCIDQDSYVKATQIQAMDKIYAGAAIVLIVASGDDSDSGIPGISRPRKLPLRAQTKDGSRYGSWRTAPEHGISESKWSTRGWTFQEGFLGRRRLMFTDQEVIWECGQKFYCESELRSAPFTNFRGFFASQGLGVSCGKIAMDFQRIIETYSQKQLTFSTDRLNALVGVLNSLCLHFEGLPYKIPGETEKNSVEHFLAFFLDWTHGSDDDTVDRIRSHASFSWAGWTGAIHIAPHVFAQLDKTPLFRIVKMHRAPLDIVQSMSTQADASTAELELEARSFGVVLADVQVDHLEEASGDRRRLVLYASREKILAVQLMQGPDMSSKSINISHILIPIRQQHRVSNTPSFGEGSLRAVLLGRTTTYDTDFLSLLLVAATGHGTFERIGLARICSLHGPTSPLLSSKWKWDGVTLGRVEELENAPLERIRLV